MKKLENGVWYEAIGIDNTYYRSEEGHIQYGFLHGLWADNLCNIEKNTGHWKIVSEDKVKKVLEDYLSNFYKLEEEATYDIINDILATETIELYNKGKWLVGERERSRFEYKKAIKNFEEQKRLNEL